MLTGKLFIVPTPIGNLEDITFRAVKVLKEVNLILAEDTRTSNKLLKHYNIHTPMQSHHMHNEHKTVDAIVQRLKSGEQIALISDAGTPAISDPGFLLCRASIEQGIEIGKEQGIEIGAEQAKINGIKKALKRGKLTVEEIAEDFEVMVDYVLEIKKTEI